MAELNPTELQESLKDMEYPAAKEDLIRQARENNADQNVVSFLERIPDQSYDSPTEVSEQMDATEEEADIDEA